MSVIVINQETMHRRAVEILRGIAPSLRSEINPSSSSQRTNYKGVHGRIGVVGGARDYAGAPYFASMSAMRLGADLAYVICSRDASQVIKNYSPDLIVTPLLDHPDESEFDREMDCLLTRLHALVVGPGLGREKLLQERAKRLIAKAKARSLPLILDADSLILINEDPDIIRSYPKALLTPNRIELQRMLDKFYAPQTFNLRTKTSDQIHDLVRKCSSDLRVTILAKGLVDIICDNTLQTPLEMRTNELSGSNRRCGGQGDITCGLASVLIRWIELANNEATNKTKIITNPVAWAGYLAIMLTRRCNEIAFQKHRRGMVASDMLDSVNLALESLLEEAASVEDSSSEQMFKYSVSLSLDEINRYTRQMKMDEFGPEAQIRLKKGSALIIGAGGLGCPAAAYLGAAGIGHLGVVDDDRVEASNLHRQILHNMEKVGMLKTESIKQAVQAVNPNVRVTTHSVKLSRENAVDIISKYDIILDCTDNLLTRYLISDACVVSKRPLVSGAALKMDGQLTVYNYDEKTPCFRCMFPDPPPPNAVGSCSENGVMGVLPGIIGVQQALEAIKIAAGLKPAYAGRMLLYDGQLGLFRNVKLGDRKNECEACGSKSKLDKNLINYEEFCGRMACKSDSKASNILNCDERVTVEQYSEILKSKRPHVLVDVRPKQHSDLSRLEHALQMPVAYMLDKPEEVLARIQAQLKSNKTREIYVVCRRGIASQRGTRILQDLLQDHEPEVILKDIIGGMTTWASRIDPDNYACL